MQTYSESSSFFSVIVPTYNRGHVITKVIDSILAQSFDDFEVIIVDDGGSDNTGQVISQMYSDKRLSYLKREVNEGVCAARNYGALMARGQFIGFLDSDDEVLDDWLLSFFKIIESNRKLRLVSCGVLYKSEDSVRKIFPESMSLFYMRQINMLAGAFFVNRNLFIESGLYDRNIFFGENFELGVRLSKHLKFEEVGVIAEILVVVYVENWKERRRRYSAVKELISSERIIELYHSEYQENQKNYLGKIYSKAAVAALLTGQISKSRLYAIKANSLLKNLKSLLRLIFIYFLPGVYCYWLNSKNYYS